MVPVPARCGHALPDRKQGVQEKWRLEAMTRQLNLFPQQSKSPDDQHEMDRLMDSGFELNAVDEIFVAGNRYRYSHAYIELMQFISRFPQYSPLNCFLLFTQNPSSTYVATAKTWRRTFGRQPRSDARPLMILAPMGPVRFVFDVSETEGDPLPPGMLKPTKPKPTQLVKIFDNTVFNCTIQGIAVVEKSLQEGNRDTATRVTPGLRKKHQNLNLKKDSNYLISLNEAYPLERKYSSLVYELGHILCGHLGIDSNAWWSERRGLNIVSEAIEAESVSFLICRRNGFIRMAEKYLSDYISGDRELPIFSLNAVLQATHYIEDMGKTRWSEPKKRSRY
jgi:hypothetical protein